MAITKERKNELISEYKIHESDTGSPEVQIALLSAKIQYLTEHLKVHKHDFHTRYGLTNLVSQRRRLLTYLKRKSAKRYQSLIKQLEIRG